MRVFVALLALLLTTALSACGGAESGGGEQTRSITHTQGTTQVPTDPKRVVVLDFGALDTVAALGLADRVVGTPKQAMPAFLNAFADPKYADVGTLAEPNYEAINKAKPDLVIVGFRSARTYAEMSKHWPTIDVTYPMDKDPVQGTAQAAGVIGNVFGKTAEVTAKVEQLRHQADRLRSRGEQAGKGLIVMTTAGKTAVHGPQSRFGAVHTIAGVAQARPDIKADSHGQPVSFELIADTNPDLMFVVDRDAAIGAQGKNAHQILDNEVIRTTHAWRNGRIVYLDGSRWYVTVHGLNNAAAMLGEIEKGLDK